MSDDNLKNKKITTAQLIRCILFFKYAPSTTNYLQR